MVFRVFMALVSVYLTRLNFLHRICYIIKWRLCSIECHPLEQPMYYSAVPQVGWKTGPEPNIQRNGTSDLALQRKRKEEKPRYTHQVIVSGANIINLPKPGVGADTI